MALTDITFSDELQLNFILETPPASYSGSIDDASEVGVTSYGYINEVQNRLFSIVGGKHIIKGSTS